jgi:hypothetical protein
MAGTALDPVTDTPTARHLMATQGGQCAQSGPIFRAGQAPAQPGPPERERGAEGRRRCGAGDARP